MSLLASTINGAGYVLSNGDDKDNGYGFEVRGIIPAVLTMFSVYAAETMASVTDAGARRVSVVLYQASGQGGHGWRDGTYTVHVEGQQHDYCLFLELIDLSRCCLSPHRSKR